MPTAIVTDSTCDIPDFAAAQYQIHIIPTMLVIENESIPDDGTFSREKYYQQLPEMKTAPTTAAPPIGMFENLYRSLFEQGFDQIVSIHVSSLLSGVYNSASAAAQAFDQRVVVVDSQQLSMGLGFQAINAAVYANRGETLESILREIERTRLATRLVAMLDTLEYVRRSGRVSWTRAVIGNVLRLKAFIDVKEGRVLRLGEARTHKKALERLREILFSLMPVAQLAILHTNASAEAEQLAADLALPESLSPYIVNITPVIGTHVGPNALGFTAIRAAPETMP